MPLTIIRSPGKEPPDKKPLDGELLDATVDLLQIQADDPAKAEARRVIMQIAEEFVRDFKETKTSPTIAEARKALKKMADKAEKLAALFEEDANKVLLVGAATFNVLDSPEVNEAKRQEIQAIRDELFASAAHLKEIAAKLRERLARWAGKQTGRLRAHDMAHGNPKKTLGVKAGLLWAQYRPDDFSSEGGDFTRCVAYLFQLATGREPIEDELTRHLRAAVRAIKKQ